MATCKCLAPGLSNYHFKALDRRIHPLVMVLFVYEADTGRPSR
jgi:hypothetical protein